MSGHFDPYQQWFGISPSEQPPIHYRLLDVRPFETDIERIEAAADQRITFLKEHLTGGNAEWARRLIQEVNAARQCLMDPRQKSAYDQRLQQPWIVPDPTLATPPGNVPESEPVSGRFEEMPASPKGPVNSPRQPVESTEAMEPSTVTQKRAPRWLLFVGAFATSFVLVIGVLFWWMSLEPNGTQSVASAHESTSISNASSAEPQPPSDLATALEVSSTRDMPAITTPIAPIVSTTVAVSPMPMLLETPSTTDETNSLPPKPPVDGSSNQGDPVPSNQSEMLADEAKLPVPTIEMQQQVLVRLNKTFDFGRTRSPEENQKLAQQLLTFSRKSAKGPSERFVVLRTAMDRAGEGGDAGLMLKAIDAISKDFDIDIWDVKQKMLGTFAQKATSVQAIDSLVESTVDLVEEAVDAQEYDEALRLIGPACLAVRRPAGGTYREEVLQRKEQIDQLFEQQQQADQAKKILATAPENGPANLTMGLWHALVQDDWAQALPYLVQGNDSALQLVAKRELLAEADDTDEQLAVADAWWELAQTRKGQEQLQFARHAGSWYERAQGQVTSAPLKTKLRSRLDQIVKLSEAGHFASKSEFKPGDRLPGLRWFELLDWMDPATNSVAGTWARKGSEIRVASGSYSRMLLPVAVDGNFDLQFDFVRTKGNDAIAVVLPIGKQGCVMVLGASRGKYSGLEMLSGKSASSNPSTRKPAKFTNNQQYTVLARVRVQGKTAAIEVTVNRSDYLRGVGPKSGLTVSKNWALRSTHRPALGAHASDITFSNVKFRVVQGGVATRATTVQSRSRRPTAKK